MKVLYTAISVFFLLFRMIFCDLKIEVMKEGLLDLKTTILRSPNVTEFSGSASEPYIGGTSGELIPFSPIDGCSELIESAPFTKRDEKTNLLRFSTVNGKSEQVIVLISRGGCNFNDKFKNAKKVKGVVGVLIYNGPDDSIPTDKIPLTNQSDDVPGYLISNSLGIEIFKKILKYRTQSSSSLNDTKIDSNSNFSAMDNLSIPYLEVTMTPISIDSTNKANTMIQIALIAIIIILALSFAASILVHMRTSQFSQTTNSPNNNNNGANNNADNNSHVPIDVEFLQKLPLKTFKGRRGSSEIQNTNNNISNSNGEKSNYNNNNNSDNSNIINNNNSNSSDYSNNNTNNHAIMYSGIKSPNYSSKSNSDSIDEKLTSPKVRDNLNLQFTNEYFAMIQHEWPMNDSCPICLDEFNQNEVLNELPCGHCYHIACIQPWLQYRSPVCPLCKLDVREEFKADLNKTIIGGNTVKPEEVTRNKLKNIWDKLIQKTRPLNDDLNGAQARTRIINNVNNVPDIINTSNTNDQVFLSTSTTIQIPQIPQRALTQDSSSSSSNNNLNSFHNIPL